MRTIAVGTAVLALVTLATAAGAAVITGTPGDDVLRGTRDADQVRALAGSDLVYARGAGDELRLGAGDDRSRAGEGADVHPHAPPAAADDALARPGDARRGRQHLLDYREDVVIGRSVVDEAGP